MNRPGLMMAIASLIASTNNMHTISHTYPVHEPDNRGRNQEKKALYIAKAEAKRERKMLKRKSK